VTNKNVAVGMSPSARNIGGSMSELINRRHAIRLAAVVGSGVILSGCAASGQHGERKGAKNEQANEEVSPAEDLMREHGVLKRILLVYGEAIRRIDTRPASGFPDLPPDPIADAAKIVRSFVEDYHEKLEENFLFPRFRKANTL